MKINHLPHASGVYKITCTANGKFYIGSARDIAKRLYGHLLNLQRGKHHAKKLIAAWAEFGEDSFIAEVVEICLPELRHEREKFWIDSLDSVNNGLNSQHGTNKPPVIDVHANLQLGAKLMDIHPAVSFALFVANKYGFSLNYHIDSDGEYWYSIHDWLAGLTGLDKKSIAIKWSNTTPPEGVITQKLPYQTKGGVYQMHFTDLHGLFMFAFNLRVVEKRLDLQEAVSAIQGYLIHCGVEVDHARNIPEPLKSMHMRFVRVLYATHEIGKPDVTACKQIIQDVYPRYVNKIILGQAAALEHHALSLMREHGYPLSTESQLYIVRHCAKNAAGLFQASKEFLAKYEVDIGHADE